MDVQRNNLIAPFSVRDDLMHVSERGKPTGKLAVTHQKWFTEAEQAMNGSAQVTANIPPSSFSNGQAGTFAADANFLYYCVALNHWKRVPLSDF